MACAHANISLPTTSDPDTVCADCGEILQDSSTAALTQTEKQSTLHPHRNARCGTDKQFSKGQTDEHSKLQHTPH
jgi:hypothetical protein